MTAPKEVSLKQFNFNIDPEVLQQFKEIAREKEDRSAGSALRQLVKEYVEQNRDK